MRFKTVLLSTIVLIGLLVSPRITLARRGFAVGLGPVGNIYLIDTTPVLDPGIGGYTYFQYRFAEQLAFQASFLITTQNGSDVSAGDTGILFLGMPTLDLKFFLLTGQPRFDPFVGLGTGLFILTEGTVGDNSGGIGVGTNILVGFDYYLTQSISLGFEGTFRTIGIISDFGTPSNSSALFPYSLMANIAFHF